MNNFKTEAFILSMGIFLSGVCVKKAVRQFSDSDRVVTVKGLSEREVPANKVVWPLVYKEMGNDPAEMYENIQAKNRQVVKFLKDHGISEAEISQNSPSVTDRKAESYEQNIPYRYIATSVTTATSDMSRKRRERVQTAWRTVAPITLRRAIWRRCCSL